MASTVLKKPIGIYALAFLFMLAPLGNIVISFAGSGVKSWYSPDVFLSLLGTIPFFEWLWLGMLVLTGILLLRPHRLSWTIAIVSLVVALSINALRLFQMDSSSIDPTFLKLFSILSIVVSLSVLVIAFYFRFPYLDRRASWLMVMTRFEMRTPLQIMIEPMTQAETLSISLSGALFETSQPQRIANLRNTAIKIRWPEIQNLELDAKVVEVSGQQIRVNFLNLKPGDKSRLQKFLIEADQNQNSRRS